MPIKEIDFCFITPNLGKGGMERFISIITKEIIFKGYKVAIITLINNSIEYEIDDRVKIYHLNEVWDKNKILLFFKLFQILKNLRPQIVIGFSEAFNPLSILASKLNGLKVYISDRSNPLLRHKLKNRIARKSLYPFANGIIAQTELAKKTLLSKRLNRNICVIPNPLIKFSNSNFDSSKRVIITTGRLEVTKNQKEILEIFSKVIKDDWNLIIVGDGSERSNLVNIAFKLGVKDRVMFAGKQDDIEYWLKKGSIYVYTSLSEGFPNALSEGIASPLASIAYNCPAGVSDLIENNINGYLIPLGNQKMFIDKLNDLMNSESLRKRFMIEGLKLRSLFKVDQITSKIINFTKH